MLFTKLSKILSIHSSNVSFLLFPQNLVYRDVYLPLCFKRFTWCNPNFRLCFPVVISRWNVSFLLFSAWSLLHAILLPGAARNLTRLYLQNFILLFYGFLFCGFPCSDFLTLVWPWWCSCSSRSKSVCVYS